MLLSTLTGLADQSIAERMRAIAVKTRCPAAIAEQAVDEAVLTFQWTRSAEDAIQAGLEFIATLQREPLQGVTRSAGADSLAAACDRLLRRPVFWVGLAFAAAGILAARAAGWLL